MDLESLYQEMILDHNKRPRNFRALAGATCQAHGRNPLCGDDYHLFFKLNAEGVIEEASFFGKGCAISKASASMLTDAVKGKTVEEAGRIAARFIELVTSENPGAEAKKKLGPLTVFEGVKKFPVRVKCATLSWRALEAALKSGGNEEISTE